MRDRAAAVPDQGDFVSARIIDGKAIAKSVQDSVRVAADRLVARGRRRPGLAVIMVGDSAASAVYVRNKRKTCGEVGILSSAHDLPGTTSQADLLALIDR